MTECCEHHDELVSAAAANNAKLDMLIEGQREFKAAIATLQAQLSTSEKSQAVEQMRIKPLWYAIGIVVVVSMTKLGEHIVDWIIKAAK